MNLQKATVRVLTAILACVIVANAAGQTPAIHKVEPPNWWAGLPEDPMLLLYGEGMEGARISVGYPGLTVAKVEPGNPGYLFVWLKLAPAVKPGTAKFLLKSVSGSTTFDFPILKRERSECAKPGLKPTGECRYAGLTKNDVLYLIMPDRFANGDTNNDDPAEARGYYDRTKARGFHGGDLKGVEQHLAYLKDLGATAIWLTPFWKNADDYHGYGPTDLYAVDPHFGNLRQYRELISAAHAQGIKFVFDYVVNHTGPGHVWSKHPPLDTWLHGTAQNHPPFDYHFEYLVDPHASKREWQNITEGWFAGVLPDLNVDDPHVAKYLLDNAIWWMELGGVDAYRLDTFPYSSRKFWSYWHKELFRIYPTANSVGEVMNFDPSITSFFEGGQKRWDGIDDGLPTLFDFPLNHAIREVLSADKGANELPRILRYDSLYQHPYDLVTMIGNHDSKRMLSEPNMDLEKLKAAFGLLLTIRGIPQLYTGDEIAMTGGDDPDNRHDFPGGWPGDKQNAFDTAGRTSEQQEVYSYVKNLLAFRQQHPALRRGKQWTIGTDANYYAYLRAEGSDKILVVFTKKGGPLSVPLADTPLASASALESIQGAPAATIAAGSINLATQGFSVAIYRVR